MKSKNGQNVWYDLHIHSCLSSCGQEENTPSNILEQCVKNGLNLISITDHNCSLQYETINRIKNDYPIEVIYGMEVTSFDGFHVLTYFEKYSELQSINEFIKDNSDLSIKNPYGPQMIVDENGMLVETLEYQINQRINCSYDLLSKKVRELNGLIVLAHVNRGGSGVLDFYEDISSFDFDAIEISKNGNPSLNIETIKTELFMKYPYLKKYKKLYNSDGHSLDRIHKRENKLLLSECSFKGFKNWLQEIEKN